MATSFLDLRLDCVFLGGVPDVVVLVRDGHSHNAFLGDDKVDVEPWDARGRACSSYFNDGRIAAEPGRVILIDHSGRGSTGGPRRLDRKLT